MKKINLPTIIIILVFVIAIIGIVFYWYVIRPEQIKDDCRSMINKGAFQFSENQYLPMTLNYEECLKAYGISQ